MFYFNHLAAAHMYYTLNYKSIGKTSLYRAKIAHVIKEIIYRTDFLYDVRYEIPSLFGDLQHRDKLPSSIDIGTEWGLNRKLPGYKPYRGEHFVFVFQFFRFGVNYKKTIFYVVEY